MIAFVVSLYFIKDSEGMVWAHIFMRILTYKDLTRYFLYLYNIFVCLPEYEPMKLNIYKNLTFDVVHFPFVCEASK